MKLVTQSNKHLSILLVFGIIGAIGISGIPNALAAADPSQNYLDSLLVQTQAADIVIEQGIGEDLTTSDGIFVYATTKATAQAAGGAGLGNCPTTVGIVDSWQLVRASDDAVIGYKFLAKNDAAQTNGVLGEVKVKYGTGIGTTSGNTVTIEANSETVITAGGTDVLPAGTNVAGYWKITQGANVINTDNTGSQSFLSCGLESPSTDYIGGDQVEIEEPVGGEILSVSMTSLLIAGISTNALWLVPLAAVAAGAFAVLRLQVYRK